MKKKYIAWRKKNVSPECVNADCQRVDRGGSCGLCALWMTKKRVK